MSEFTESSPSEKSEKNPKKFGGRCKCGGCGREFKMPWKDIHLTNVSSKNNIQHLTAVRCVEEDCRQITTRNVAPWSAEAIKVGGGLVLDIDIDFIQETEGLPPTISAESAQEQITNDLLDLHSLPTDEVYHQFIIS